MRMQLILATVLLLACSSIARADEGCDPFSFPVRVEKVFNIEGGNYEIRLHDLPGKGIIGFAWSVMRNGYLIKFEIVDGVSPSIIPMPTAQKNQFGISYKAGAYQSVLDIVGLSKDGFVNFKPGLISSNLACIYRDGENTLLSVSEHDGRMLIDRFHVTESAVTVSPVIHVPKSDVAGIMKTCSAKSYFGRETR
jgi:hypothetical protein